MGPVQLLVLAVAGDGEGLAAIRAELDQLRAHDTIRLLDLLLVAKDESGELRIAEAGDDDTPDAAPGRYIVPLLDGEEADLSHLEGVDEAELWDAAAAIPAGSVAAVALVEHRWAIGLSAAFNRAAGVAVLDAWVAPADLASVGLTG
jgi:hypothetical protein